METKAGTIGGTLLVVLLHIGRMQILDTAILAGIGAVVSFGVSRGMKWVIGKWRRS